MTRGAWIALAVVAAALVGVGVYFLVIHRQDQPDPLAAGVAGVTGVVTTLGKTAGEIVGVPVRVANDVISVAEKPFKVIGSIF